MALGLARALARESLHKFRGYPGRERSTAGDGNLCSSWHFIILTALSRAHIGLGASKRAPSFCLPARRLYLPLPLPLFLPSSFPKEKQASGLSNLCPAILLFLYPKPQDNFPAQLSGWFLAGSLMSPRNRTLCCYVVL